MADELFSWKLKLISDLCVDSQVGKVFPPYQFSFHPIFNVLRENPMRTNVWTVIAAIVALGAAGANAQANPEDAIKYRQSAYKVMAWNFSPMAAMVKGEKPYDKEAFIRHAAIVEFVSKLPGEGYVPGSDKGADTKAKPEIWARMDDFRSKMFKMHEETAKLSAVAKTGSFDEIKKQFGATGSTCKVCHDDYKNK
jgi:cytochrome c556